MSTLSADTTAIVLFNLGGPDDLASVEPFLVNLFSDREIIELPVGPALQPFFARAIASCGAFLRNYARIGGGSPQLGSPATGGGPRGAAERRRLRQPRVQRVRGHAILATVLR